MVRKIALILCLGLITSGLVVAQATENDVDSDPLMAPGDIALTAGVGYGFLWGAIDVSGGVEVMVSSFDVADLPVSIGIAGKFNYYRIGNATFVGDYYFSYLGGGGFATAHASLNSFDLDPSFAWLSRLDFYIGAGIGFYNYTNSYLDTTTVGYDRFQIGLRTTGGVNYFFTDNLALVFEGGYYGGWGGGLIALLFKL
jgi:hypothetical protein